MGEQLYVIIHSFFHLLTPFYVLKERTEINICIGDPMSARDDGISYAEVSKNPQISVT